MKKWSIRTKITLLFTVALTLMATLSCLIVFSVSHQVIQKTVRDNLIENVERNVDEIEYYETLDALDAPSRVSGRVTAQLELAQAGTFESETATPLGHEAFFKAENAAGYEIVADTRGTLRWDGAEGNARD